MERIPAIPRVQYSESSHQCYTRPVPVFFPSRTVAIMIAGFPVHWYGIMYLLAFLLAAVLLPRLQRLRKLYLSRDEWLSIVSWAVIGVIVGGRLGYIFFYEPKYFTYHPMEAFFVWEGGMSFHGGFLGLVCALVFACLRRKVSMLRMADVVVVPAAIGLAFGRLGNFINLELYGTLTDLPWGVTIPGMEGLRHPTQLYAVGKDLLIALVCFLHLRYAVRANPGRTFALFLMLYGVGRFLLEYLREQEYPLTYLGALTLTRGQLLTLPMFLFGMLLWIWLRKEQQEEGS